MKKLMILLLCLVLCLGLAACGGAKEDTSAADTADTAADTAAAETASDGYVFKSGSTTVAMDADMETVLAGLGDPIEYFESESCAFQGLDKVYTYNSFVIKTYPENDKDYVLSVELKDDTVSTAEGVAIGDSKDAVTGAYGDADTDTGTAYIYNKGNSILTFIFTDDAVSAITYTSTANS